MKHPFHLIDLVTLKRVASLFSGNYRTSFHGSWVEFADIREYATGDDVGDIDWKTTARTGKVFIKKYEEDRERKVLFVVDMGSNMRFWSGERTKFDTLGEIFSILSFSSVENGDPIGAWFFADRLIETLDIKKWQAHLGRIRKDFEALRRASVGESSLSVAVWELYRRRIKNSLIFVFSDSLDLPPDTELRSIGIQNDAIFVRVFDHFENTLESNTSIHAVSASGDIFIDPDDQKKKELYRSRRSEELEQFRRKIRGLGWSYLALDETDNAYKKLYWFFKGRQHR